MPAPRLPLVNAPCSYHLLPHCLSASLTPPQKVSCGVLELKEGPGYVPPHPRIVRKPKPSQDLGISGLRAVLL